MRGLCLEGPFARLGSEEPELHLGHGARSSTQGPRRDCCCGFVAMPLVSIVVFTAAAGFNGLAAAAPAVMSTWLSMECAAVRKQREFWIHEMCSIKCGR